MPKGVYNRKKDEVEVERDATAVLQDIEKSQERAQPIPQNTEELEAALREEAMANALPNFPKRPGTHYLWGSTTNQQVPIQFFLRLGYQIVKHEEIPEFNHLKIHSGEYAGGIGINEMIGLKCPEEFYQRYMKVTHADKPNQEEEKLDQSIKTMKQEEDREGRKLITEEGDGFKNIIDRRPVRRPFE